MALLGTVLASTPLPRRAVCDPDRLITQSTINADLRKRLDVNHASAVQILNVVVC